MTKTLPDVVVLDTCVLLSSVLRTALLALAQQGCFAVAWSTVIGDEWKRNAARLWKTSVDDIERQWDVLQQRFPAADQGDVSPYKEGLRQSDPKDHHVVAAGRAVCSRRPEARVAVVTRNLRDFNRSELRRNGLGLYDPDQFLVLCRDHCAETLTQILVTLPEQVVSPGRDQEPLPVLLKRERLFRLSRVLPCLP